MPREASKPRFHGVYPLDPASESKVLNDAPRHPERLLERAPLLMQKDDNRRKIPERHKATACLRTGNLGFGNHLRRVLVNAAAVGVQDLIQKPPRLLLPLAAVALEVRLRLLPVHENIPR